MAKHNGSSTATLEKSETLETPDQIAVHIPQIEVQRMEITVIGDSELIMHRWSDKAKQMMLDKQMKKAKTAKEAKDPDQDYQESMYRTADDGYAFPSVAFKACAVSGCRFADGIKMTQARGAFHVDGEFTEIIGEPHMREDMVRIGMGTADIRYRAGFTDWKAALTVSYNTAALSPEQIINLFNLGGFGVGVGEWRPEKDGPFGRFHVETSAD